MKICHSGISGIGIETRAGASFDPLFHIASFGGALNRFVLAAMLLPATWLSAQGAILGTDRPATVTTLGTLHAYMLKNPDYTLGNFIAAMETYKPDLILTEVRPAFPGPISGSIDGSIEQSVVYAVAKHLGAEVIPVDWFDEKLFEESMREETRITPTMNKELEAASDGYQRDFENSSILRLNSSATQKKARAIYTLQVKFGLMQARNRNERICANIKAALGKSSGRNAMIIFGLDHKYFIDDCVRSLPGQKPVEVGSWLTPEALSSYHVPLMVKDEALENVRASERLLKRRLDSGYYSGAFKKKLSEKLNSYPLWVQALERL